LSNRENFQSHISKFFSEYKVEDSCFKDQSIFICRNDGVIVYFRGLKNGPDQNSVGALVSGLWQAGKTVIDMFSTGDDSDFRLSFDTSSSGIHVLPFYHHTNEYFLGAVFKEVVNPAQLKSKLKFLLFDIEENLKTLKKSDNGASPEGGALFNDITDDEINNLFSFAE
jgi:hypothetical protein